MTQISHAEPECSVWTTQFKSASWKLLDPVSVQTTERHIGCKQRLRVAVNDRLGIEPDKFFIMQLDT